MKNIKRILVGVGIALGFAVTTAQAADLEAYHGQKIELGSVNGVAYYTVEKNGYRVVATLAGDNSSTVRFEAVLAPGQTVVMSSPVALGEVPARIEISRRENRVQVNKTIVTN